MNALANAKALARHGYKVFPSSRDLPDVDADATSDIGQIERWGLKYPDAVWMCRCNGGLVVISSKEFETLSAELGEPPMTLRVARTGGGGDVRWYRCDASAEIKLRTKLRRSAVVPGSRHANGESYEVVGGMMFAVGRIAHLPEFWVAALAPTGITTADYVERFEFNAERFKRGFGNEQRNRNR